ncbi:PucR family transcriptional regulator [Streptomyces sp. NPDC059009]|uniref:PucR family transcriptional regulator n=1 Tax=Streptomyces sp. NPDC059009 TaxID=3346694 RepID=UPI0036AA39A1
MDAASKSEAMGPEAGLGPQPPSGLAALLPRVGAIAAAAAARCVTEIPDYRELPAHVLDGDLVANTEAVLRLFVTTAGEGRPPTQEELDAPIAWGAERARDGVPLHAVLRIYPLGAREAWRLVRAEPGVGIDPDLLAERLLDFLGAVVPRVAEAYLRERAHLDWELREHRQGLAGTLLAGRPARRAAERYGRTLADRYEVVVWRIPEPPSATRSGPARGRSRGRVGTDGLRAIRSELDLSPEVLATFKGDGGVLLVPADEQSADQRRAGERQGDAVAALLARLERAAATPCTAASALAPHHDAIPAAHAEATEVLSLAEHLRRPPGRYRLADLAIEYQLARPGPARSALADTLAPLARHAHLVDTLREFIQCGYRRGEAAAALTVHRNTLTYRLGRIQVLTGYDPTVPDDARRLAAAMTAYDIVRSAG